MINSRGKALVHEELIKQVLSNLMAPREVAVVHVKGHQRGDSLEIRGNRLADEMAKEAALNPEPIIMCIMTPVVSTPQEVPYFTEKEKRELEQWGVIKDAKGKWWMPDGREMLNKPIMREIMANLHSGSHWGIQAMCDIILRKYGCRGIYTIAKQVCEGCISCTRINKGALRKQTRGGREPSLRPFQSIQVDFTELPPVGKLKYVLVLVDHLTGWVEAYPMTTATASGVSKTILEQIVPRYGLVENIDSDRGSHFTSKVLQETMRSLEINWDFHTPWHPPSSGRVERMNQTLKNHLSKLILETKLPWTKCLPIALLRIRTAPRKDLGLSPYEMLFGLPYLGTMGELPIAECRDMYVKKYILALSSSLSFLRKQGLLAQTPPLEFPAHRIVPGDWVLTKTWRETKLQPTWEGPFLVLLTTETAVRTAEKGWTHYTRIKGPTPPPLEQGQWHAEATDEPLKLAIEETKTDFERS